MFIRLYKKIDGETIALEAVSSYSIDTILVNSTNFDSLKIVGKAIGQFGKF